MWQAGRLGHRRRVADALHHRFTAEVPFVECYVADTIVDQVLGTHQGRHMLQLEPRDLVEFLTRAGMDAAYIYEGWFLARRNYTDENGRVHYVDGTIKSRADFEQIKPPPLDRVRARIEGYLKAAQHTDLGCIFSPDTTDSLAFSAIGPTDFMLACHDDPGFIDEFMDRVEEYVLGSLACALEYPLDAIVITGPLCAKDGPMMSPDMHDRFVFPRMQKLLELVRPRGLPVILHVDGDSHAFLDRYAAMGISALHPIEANLAHFDIYDLSRNWGDRFCLWGNIDVSGVLSQGTPDEVARDTRRHLEQLAPGGGYICGSSHDISECIPFRNFCALAETICRTRVAEP